MLRDWHKRGMRGLRFHLFPQRPNYIRGVGLDVFAAFRKTMAELGWVVQFFLRSPHAFGNRRGDGDPNFQALLKLVGDGHAYVKLSAVYRLSTQFPDYGRAAAA
jgi:hypothetical protein